MRGKSKLKQQKDFADLMLSRSFDGNIEDLCEKCGITFEVFNSWLEDTKFKTLLEKSLEKHNYEEISVVWKALIDLCEKGNIQAIKFYFELRDKYKGASTPLAENLIQIIDDIPKGGEEEE